MAFEDLLPPTSPRSDAGSAGTSSRTASSRATPPHLKNPRATYRQRAETSPTRAINTNLSTPRPFIAPTRRQFTAPQQQSRLMFNPPRPGRSPPNALELRVDLQKVPRSWTTWDIYDFFRIYGNVTNVSIRERRTLDLNAVIIFQPAPRDIAWVGRPLNVSDPDGHQRIIETRNSTSRMSMYRSPHDPTKEIPERMVVALAELDFGMMKDESEYLILHSAEPMPSIHTQVAMNLQFKELNLSFPVKGREFRFQINTAQVIQAFHLAQDDGSHSIILGLDNPPLAFRKSNNIRATHDKENPSWNESRIWFRQTDIDNDPRSRDCPVGLRKTNCVVDIGRWKTYRLKFSPGAVASADYQNFCQALADHNIVLIRDKNFTFTYDQPCEIWSWVDDEPAGNEVVEGSFSALEALHESLHYLPFKLRYQLEVCLSLGLLLECNIDREFLKRLAEMDLTRAVKVLEKVADNKERIYDPMTVFKLQNQVSVAKKKKPDYCTEIGSVVLTPSTMYAATMVRETSNRVIRQFKDHEDRFLRVKFTDERYKGKIWSSDDNRMNEVFSRIKRTMTHGIQIGDRHYEFLAFGNSQFREHGAYFFAPTEKLTAEMIREWMGRFSHIRVVAKYVSRLGQCFSTTRAIPHKIEQVNIEDVERNGYCFTDGAGTMSPFLARMIALHHNMPNSEQNFPSAVQFRLAGCKGVLAVNPALKGFSIQIRPSQEKFHAEYHGLEICRISQFSTANLNMQIILVLSALGIDDEVFLHKMRAMLVDIKEAMTDERKALELLQKNIDYSQTTILLATMIFDGFMETQDPFMITCLRLWRSWCLKYLKEKARIYVEQGFFGLAVPDETGTLRGHYDKPKSEESGEAEDSDEHDAGKGAVVSDKDLPEIFLQVPDPDAPGKYRVILGICILARNPSLHPGDVRKVRAVDKPELHHLRDVVVIPTTGDRDLANMCSGGDLDGDDFMVIWDPDFIPSGEDHPPMDYTSPDPVTSDGPVSVDDMTTFFVKHIKNDNLSSIAVAHRYWADQLADGVKDAKCIELAQLHSKAVDYPKTGVPAVMTPGLKVQKWPHWSEPKNKSRHKIYHSNRVLGKLYDEVKKEPFYAAWDLPFDQRILTACEPSVQMLADAREVKAEYDEAVQRIMTQHGIKTEFEIWTTFVLDHHQEIGDYKFAETIGSIVTALVDEHRERCKEKAGIKSSSNEATKPGDDLLKVVKARAGQKEHDDKQLELFIVAMYKVTAEEVKAAYDETKIMRQKGGRDVPLRALTFESMPFMSFPWIFARELGQIATKGKTKSSLAAMPRPTVPTKAKASEKKRFDLLGDDFELPSLPETSLSTESGTVQEGDVLGLFGGGTSASRAKKTKSEELVINTDTSSATKSLPLQELHPRSASLELVGLDEALPVNGKPASSKAQSVSESAFLENREFQPATEPLYSEVPTRDSGTAQIGVADADGTEYESDGATTGLEFEIMSSTIEDKFAKLFGGDDQ
ncbi:RNA-dependent RNA polymerase 1 [Pseudocercospora fuligena]|uniref:RNA-dependent RNA polymerase n=1 Tax=Pseudocercospora fuligena TaxID=685502 RepID=A0A8H6RA11_9PEZI|nr:RNA-dependent RNA polymerase 1 [Pseudocercospora fuligena]